MTVERPWGPTGKWDRIIQEAEKELDKNVIHNQQDKHRKRHRDQTVGEPLPGKEINEINALFPNPPENDDYAAIGPDQG